MSESERFRDWLNVPDELFITCLWRPTARRVAIWRNNNKLTWLCAGDELRPKGRNCHYDLLVLRAWFSRAANVRSVPYCANKITIFRSLRKRGVLMQADA